MRSAISCFIVVMLFIGCSKTNDFLEYKNAQMGIAMNYPTDWKFKDVGAGIWFTPQDQKKMTPALILTVNPLAQNISNLDQLMDVVVPSLKARYSQEGFDSPVESMLGGNPAREIRYKSKFNIKHLWILTILDGKIYEVWFQGEEKRFEALLPVVSKMMSSYQIN